MVYQDCIAILNRKLESFSSLKQYRDFRITEAEKLLVDHFRIQRNAMREMIDTRGRLYASASFENYEQTTKEQKAVVKMLREYAKDFPNRLKAGQNIILVGQCGTGKDHLLMALAKEIFEIHVVPTHWEQGVKLLNDIRDADFERSTRPRRTTKDLGWSHSANCKGKEQLAEKLAPLAGECYYSSSEPVEQVCPILWMSDIVPPTGPLTAYQQTTLFNLIDLRYSSVLPTWVTVNAVDADEELDDLIGDQSADRLRDGALVLGCCWSSYRKIGRTRPAKNDADLWPLPDITIPEWLQAEDHAEDRRERFRWLEEQREAKAKADQAEREAYAESYARIQEQLAGLDTTISDNQ